MRKLRYRELEELGVRSNSEGVMERSGYREPHWAGRD